MTAKRKGNALSQYGIIIALISVMLIPVFSHVGKNIVNALTGLSTGLNSGIESKKAFDSSQKALAENALLPQNENTTTSLPLSTACQNGDCIINFGTFALQGIPEDFSAFVETAGAAGGTEKLAQLLFQLADQVEQNNTGDAKVQDDIKKLATTTHNIAVIHHISESLIQDCKGDIAGCKSYLHNKIHQTVEKPADFDESYYPYPSDKKLGSLNDAGRIASLKGYTNDNELTQHVFQNTFADIQNNPSLSPELKQTITEISRQVSILGQSTETSVESFVYANSLNTNKDPLTGEIIPQEKNLTPENFTQELSSRVTNLHGALLCNSGNRTDTGTECH